MRHANSRLPRPIFVIGCNRSGTTLLFNNLSAHPDTWSLYIEAQDTWHRHFPVDPDAGEQVTRLPGADVGVAIQEELYQQAHNKERFKDTAFLRYIPRKAIQRPVGRLFKGKSIRLVEKTPANTLRIPLLRAIFPDARFVFLVRRGEDVVSSLMEGWKNWSNTGPVWRFTKWHYLVPPGWQDYTTRPLQEICAFQWIQSTLRAWDDLTRGSADDFILMRHEEIMASPREEYSRVLEFCGLRPSPYLEGVIGAIRRRVFTTGGSRPRAEKWRAMHEKEIESVRDRLAPVNRLFYQD